MTRPLGGSVARRDRAITALAASLLVLGAAAGLLVGPGAEAGRTGPLMLSSTGSDGPAYPAGASATRYRGLAFDTCAAPSRPAMRAWRASPYRAVGIYISGGNRACAQPQLTASWVADVTAMGWKLLPINMGLQAPCRDNLRKAPMKAAQAGTQGIAEAAAAATSARTLGILAGSVIYADIENYDPKRRGCARAVAEYVSGFTRELHRQGYLAGMYGNLGSGLAHASARYASATHARPDSVWLARWDRTTNLRGWAGIPDEHWGVRARVKQYRGDHVEKHGGVRMLIDSDVVDAPVATVARPYPVTSTAPLNVRRGPSTTAAILGTREPGTTVTVICQVAAGAPGAARWNKLADGSYVADAYVAGGAPKPVGPCSYPTQVMPGTGTVTRTGPGPGPAYAPSTTLPLGSLAWVSCRANESWLRLQNGTFAAAADLASTPADLPTC